MTDVPRPSGSGPEPERLSYEDEVRLCVFRVGGQDYVIDIMRIREIVRPLPLTAVPRGSPIIEGVIDLRGTIIPVVDLRRLLGAPAGAPTRSTKQIIVTVVGKLLGLVVDGMGRVIQVSRSAIRPAPSLFEDEDQRVFPGVVRHGGRLFLLLNLQALLEGEPPSPTKLEQMRDATLVTAGVD